MQLLFVTFCLLTKTIVKGNNLLPRATVKENECSQVE